MGLHFLTARWLEESQQLPAGIRALTYHLLLGTSPAVVILKEAISTYGSFALAYDCTGTGVKKYSVATAGYPGGAHPRGELEPACGPGMEQRR